MRQKELLHQADLKVKEAAAELRDTYRLHYHLMPQANWMNDPNGLVYFQGYYHVFYQHHPFSPQWGPMHWGHALTRDFLTWEHLPIALTPSEQYDLDGCFSGSAVVEDGALNVFYTGVRKVGGELRQVQCRAVSFDGIHFVKDPRNPLISTYPPEGSADFRDPKVWKHGYEWYMAVGSGKDGRGRVLLYRSRDLCQWHYMGVALESDGTQGSIWECPDLFPLGDKHVLVVSPMGTDPRRVIYFVGEMDYEVGRFCPESAGVLDQGPDFYAPQTFFGTDRRLMLAWMQAWESEIPTQQDGWAGALTLPRELLLDSAGRLVVRPVAELEKLRERLVFAGKLVVESGAQSLPGFDLQAGGLEVVLSVDLAQGAAGEFGIRFRDAQSGEWIAVGVRDQGRELFLDTTGASWGNEGVFCSRLDAPQEKLEIRIFLDRSSIEVFCDGVASITARIYPSSFQLVPELFAAGGMLQVRNLEVWNIGVGS